MLSFKSLMNMEEGKTSPAPTVVNPSLTTSTTTPAGGDDLSSWLNSYNRRTQSTVGSLFDSISSSIKTATGTGTARTASPALETPDPTPVPAASTTWWSSWVKATPEETVELVPGSNTTSTSSDTPASTTLSFSSPSSWLPSFQSNLPSVPLSDSSECFGLTASQRLSLFFLSVFAGVLMLFMSFTFLSLLFLGNTAKFSISYALSNVFFLLSSTFLTGPKKQLTTMFESKRALISAVYLSSLAAVLYASWQMPVFYIIIPLLCIQVAALVSYVLSYLPFGIPMMKRLFSVFVSTITRLLQ